MTGGREVSRVLSCVAGFVEMRHDTSQRIRAERVRIGWCEGFLRWVDGRRSEGKETAIGILGNIRINSEKLVLVP